MKARIVPFKVGGLGVLYGLDHLLRYQLDVVVYAGEMLHHVEYKRGARS